MTREPFFVPEWAYEGYAAAPLIAEAAAALWPKHWSLPELYAPRPSEQRERFRHELSTLGIRVRCNGGSMTDDMIRGLVFNGEPWSRHFFVELQPPFRYADPATRTIVLEVHDGAAVRHWDMGDAVGLINLYTWHWMQHVVWRNPAILAGLNLGSIDGDLLRVALNLPAYGRPVFTIKNPPPMSPALEVVADLVGRGTYTNAYLLAAYTEAGGTAANIAEVLGQLRGALGLTKESATLRDGIVGTLRAAAARFDAYGDASAAYQLRTWAENEEQVSSILAGFYR